MPPSAGIERAVPEVQTNWGAQPPKVHRVRGAAFLLVFAACQVNRGLHVCKGPGGFRGQRALGIVGGSGRQRPLG